MVSVSVSLISEGLGESVPNAVENLAHAKKQQARDIREIRLFRSLDVRNDGFVLAADLLDVLKRAGLSLQDTRLREMMARLEQYTLRDGLDLNQFCELIRPNILLIEQALQGTLVIPDFEDFCSSLEQIFIATKENISGRVADYIPQLARVDPELYGAAVCTIDGQRWSIGDSQTDFCVQSCCKPINYCLALEEHGEDYVHAFVGREPSGRIFDDLTLSEEGKPHNPMINAGAIMCSALIRPDLDVADRFDYVRSKWRALAGNQRIGFNNAVYQSERQTADRNFALGYYMREHGAFPASTDLLQVLEFYFQCCSIELNAENLSSLAATLANGGVCPVTGDRILRTQNVQHCLSLMCSCGMYDYSGEFAFTIGLPAKSGVGGGLMVVIPNVMGLCLWSPRLDCHGNSSRGVEFCKRMVSTFNFHNYDNLTGGSDKVDPRVSRTKTSSSKVNELIWAASKGDHGAVHRLIVRGFDQDAADYDRRTALHLAAAEGREQVVSYLIQNGAVLNPQDRWGGTPLDDAQRHKHDNIVMLLEEHGGIGSNSSSEHTDESLITNNESNNSEADASAIVELIYAASEGDLQAVQRMVARGVDLNAADYDLRTPLHLAAAEGHEHVVQYLLDHGVPPSPEDRWGKTPLAESQRQGYSRVSQLLKSKESP